MDEHELRGLFADLGRRLSEIRHDANNPLAIVSGNAQLLRELAQMQGLGDEFIGPINDIVEASERTSDALNELTLLQRSLPGEDATE
jgi:signal transduction histidine kinase